MLPQAEQGSPEFWAEQTPGAVAIVKDDRAMTYADWNEQANRLADALSKLGLQPGERIGMRFRIDFPWFIFSAHCKNLVLPWLPSTGS